MRDDSANWAPARGLDRETFRSNGVCISVVRPERQTIISGSVGKALELAGVTTAIGWPEPSTGPTYAVRVRRDRILVINGPHLKDGWHEDAGLAVSDMTDGYSIIEIEGENSLAVLRKGTEISLAEPSGSVARNFFGYPAMIYAHEGGERFRLHVARGHLEGIWSLLESFAEQAAV